LRYGADGVEAEGFNKLTFVSSLTFVGVFVSGFVGVFVSSFAGSFAGSFGDR
jgi:hypothetical protein